MTTNAPAVMSGSTPADLRTDVASTTAIDDIDGLFLVHYDGVYRLIFNIVGDQQEAEDLAQETFLRLVCQRFEDDRDHNLRAWLYRVATNLAYNAVRGRNRRAKRHNLALNVDEAAESVAANLADPAELALRVAEQEEVRRALGRLPERQQRLLLLRHAGLSYRELAISLDLAPSSVGTLLARAHQAFEAAYRSLTDLSQGDE